MFNKLKRRLLWMNLVMISLLMMISFGILYYITSWISHNAAEKEMLTVTQAYLAKAGTEGEETHTGNPGVQGNRPVGTDSQSAFTIEVNSDMEPIGKPVDLSEASTDRVQALTRIRASGKDSGAYVDDGIQWSYISTETHDGYLYVFQDTTSQYHLLRGIVTGFIITYIFVLLIVYILSVYLTNQSIRPIRESFEKQEQFVHDASHELKTPLAVIRSNIDVILASDKYSRTGDDKWLGYIKTEVDRMTRLTENLLSLAEIDGTKDAKSYWQACDLSNIVLHHTLGMEVLAYEKKLQFTKDIERDLVVMGDLEQLSQAVMILMDNALKYSANQGIIHVSLKQEKAFVVYKTENTCNQLTDEQATKIFDRFYKLDKARNRSQGSYGLGLSIAKSIVEAHGGKITCSNSKKGYAVFEIRLRNKPRFKKL